MAIFDGYQRERQPSPAMIKRWRPVIIHLVDYLGHDEPRTISADDIGWKDALVGQGASGRTICEVNLTTAEVVFAWGVELLMLCRYVPTGKPRRSRSLLDEPPIAPGSDRRPGRTA